MKAFDCVDHNILLKKMFNLSIDGIELEFFRSYLSNGSVRTIINKNYSSVSSIDFGVPQGSLLGPILFLIFINDFFSFFDDNLIVFADDSTLLISAIDLNTLKLKTNEALNCVIQWSNSNNLFLNIKKTKFMKFFSNDFFINLPLNTIEEVQSIKLLGIYFDNKFKFSYHISFIIEKLKTLFHLFYRIRNLLNDNAKFLCYYAFVHSVINYCTFIYTNTSKGNIDKLFVIQKQLIKCLFMKNYLIPSVDLFNELNILSLPNIIKLSNFRFISHALFYNHQPSYVADSFNSKISLRSKRYFKFILFKKPKKGNDLLFNMLELWNNFNIEYKNEHFSVIKLILDFKKSLRGRIT